MQITKKWITDRAIDHTKLDSSDSFTVQGLSAQNVFVGDSTFSGSALNINGDVTVAGSSIYLASAGPSLAMNTDVNLLNSSGNVTISTIGTGSFTSMGEMTLGSLAGDTTVKAGGNLNLVGTTVITGDMNVAGNVIDLESTGDSTISVTGNLITGAGFIDTYADTTTRVGAGEAIYLSAPELLINPNQITSFGDLNVTAPNMKIVIAGDATQTVTNNLITAAGYVDTYADTTTRVGAGEAIYLSAPELLMNPNQITSFGDLNVTAPNMNIVIAGDATQTVTDLLLNAVDFTCNLTGNEHHLISGSLIASAGDKIEISSLADSTFSSALGNISIDAAGLAILDGATGVRIDSANDATISTANGISLSSAGSISVGCLGPISISNGTDRTIGGSGDTAFVNAGNIVLSCGGAIMVGASAGDTTAAVIGGVTFNFTKGLLTSIT